MSTGNKDSGAVGPEENLHGHHDSPDVDALAFELLTRCEAEEIEAMSIEEVRAELARSGIDVDEVIARIRDMVR